MKIIQASFVYTAFLSLLFIGFIFTVPGLALIDAPTKSSHSPPILLTRENYLPEVLRIIDGAGEDVFVSQYLITFKPDDVNDPVGRLVQALVEARKRGVAVTVAMEGSDFNRQTNQPALEYLQKNNISAYFDTPAVINHEKIIIIDRHLAVVGSTNWTRSAVLYNREADILLDDPVFAGRLLAQFPIRIEPGVRFPFALLQNQRFRQLISDNSPDQFDLYLLLLHDASPSGEVIVDYDVLATRPDYKIPTERGAFWRLLRRLEGKGLIKWDEENKKVVIPEYPPQEESSYFQIPFGYWQDGYSLKLALTAKYLYLISLAETSKSIIYPWWFRSYDDLARLYGISVTTVGDGLNQLENANILEIDRQLFTENGRTRTNRYYLDPLVPEQDRLAAWQSLEGEFGKDRVARVRAMAEVMNEPNDPNVARRIIGLEDQYGQAKVDKAFSIIKGYSASSGRRQVDYFVWLVGQV